MVRSSIESNVKEILLGIPTDKELKIDYFVNNTFCKRACQNLNALGRIAPFTNTNKGEQS